MRTKQLTQKERYHIWASLKRGVSQKDIAEIIGVHPSTICREIQRNKDEITQEYHYAFADIKSNIRKKSKHKYTVITSKIKTYIKTKLKEDYSPEQIAGRMKRDKGFTVCHETIYRYIYNNKSRGGKLYKYLRHKNKKYHNRANKYQRRGIIIDRVFIDKRPKIVDKKSKFTLIKKVPSKHAEVVTSALIEMLEPIKPMIKTITYDNGKEFAYHKEVSQILDIDFYFANPYHS